MFSVMYPVNPVFDRSSKKRKKDLPAKVYSPENDTLNWEWRNPPEESVPVTFCLDTSLHGLKYLGQPKRHVFERFFWLVAFVASVVTATLLINSVWSEYTNMPIITVFNPTEKTLDAIPFPSVTVCNVNGIQKPTFQSQVGKILLNIGKKAMKIIENEELLESLAMFVDMNYICDNTLPFAKRIVGNSTIMQWYHSIKVTVSNNLKEIEKHLNPTRTLRKVSQPCNKMILHCIWHDTLTNCSELFHEIETDYGFCCTFNTAPVTLLMKNITDKRDSEERLESWRHANLDYENIMFTEETNNRTVPFRQRYPGKSAGLSFLLDPELEKYFCTNTNSEGFMMGINVPLDFPRMKDTGIAIKTNAEVFVGIRPEVTMSEDSVKSFPLEKRHCYYGNEYDLPHYTMYTTSNCLNECIARKTLQQCSCLKYYMPHNHSDLLCRPQSYNCTEEVHREIISSGLSTECQECLPTCTEISYHKEVTILRLQETQLDTLKETFQETFQTQDVSIVHVYFNTDSVYPRLRKQLTSLTQLLSNAGGLLGLCMGFSVLSLLEIVYYGTVRLCCSLYREKTIQNHVEKSGMDITSNQNDQEVEPINDRREWFSKIFNGTSKIKNINGKGKLKIRNPLVETVHDLDGDNVFKVHDTESVPVYFRGSFEDQFRRAFLTNFSEARFTYPKVHLLHVDFHKAIMCKIP